MESKRIVVTEAEILKVTCPKCNATIARGCLDGNRNPLSYEIGATELSFHNARILRAYANQLNAKFGKILSPSEKSLIVYYAFIMLCDSVSVKSLEMFNKAMSSEEVQGFFAKQAIDELRKDRLLP